MTNQGVVKLLTFAKEILNLIIGAEGLKSAPNGI